MALSTPILEICSRWWEGSNQKHELTRSAVMIFALLLAISWYAWLLFKPKNGASGLPPGPRGLPLLGSLPFLEPDLHIYFAKLARTHGPIYKIWLGNKLNIVISSPSLARVILKDQDTTFANRDVPATSASIYNGIDIAFSPYGPEWRMLRKVCVREVLSSASLDAVYHLRRREVRATVGHLYRNSGVPVSIGEQMFLTVLNVITSMMWGGTIEGEERNRLGAEFRDFVSEITDMLGKPNVSDFFTWLARFDLQGNVRRVKRAVGRFERIFELVLDRRLKMRREETEGESREKGDRDFLQHLLRLKEAGDSKPPLTMTHVKSLLLDMVVGGTETTSNTIEWAMAEIIQNPEVIRKAQDELDAVVGRDNIIKESHLSQLLYLEAIVKEVLRLHPVLPLMVPHSPSQTSTVSGYTIPKGTRVFVHVWAIHRDPSIWPNPTSFEPERFLGANDKWDFSGNDFRYFPFGSGRRMCAGIPMAERMVMYALGSLLHSFEWRLPDGINNDLAEKFGIVMKKAAPLIAIPTPRLSNPDLYT